MTSLNFWIFSRKSKLMNIMRIITIGEHLNLLWALVVMPINSPWNSYYVKHHLFSLISTISSMSSHFARMTQFFTYLVLWFMIEEVRYCLISANAAQLSSKATKIQSFVSSVTRPTARSVVLKNFLFPRILRKKVTSARFVNESSTWRKIWVLIMPR